MKRTIVRLQVLLLVLAVGLVGYRILDGTPPPAGTLVLHDIGEDHLVAGTLVLTGEPQRVALHAVGSFAGKEQQTLQAYPWLVDRDTREVVWQMERPARVRGTVAEQRDTITLGPGTYDAFFASYGNGERPASSGLFDASRRWRSDAPRWQFVVRALGDPAFARGGTFSGGWSREQWSEARPLSDNRVWSSAPDVTDEATATLIVRQPATLDVYAVGPLQPTQPSPVEIVPAGGDTPVWSIPMDETTSAGGGRQNRQYRGRFTLAPGLYAIRYEPGRGWHRWNANPPYDPAAWGITLATATPEAVQRFEPYETLSPALALDRVEDDANRSLRFRVTRTVPVLVYAMGEMTSSTSRYDYGWIEREDGTRVWEMDYDDTRHAGGARKNRVAEAWMTLPPGQYTLRYRSDGSHSFEHFNESEPDHPERWGIALFTATPDALVRASEAFEASDSDAPPAAGARVEAVQADLQPPPPLDGATVALTRTGNGENLSADFEVRRPTSYRLYATGEISGSARYDFATLLDASGRVVWEMTESATIGAGGVSRNRVFDGTLTLEPGRYTMRYETDSNHAYGAFAAGEEPAYPNAWGVILRPLDR